MNWSYIGCWGPTRWEIDALSRIKSPRIIKFIVTTGWCHPKNGTFKFCFTVSLQTFHLSQDNDQVQVGAWVHTRGYVVGLYWWVRRSVGKRVSTTNFGFLKAFNILPYSPRYLHCVRYCTVGSKSPDRWLRPVRGLLGYPPRDQDCYLHMGSTSKHFPFPTCCCLLDFASSTICDLAVSWRGIATAYHTHVGSTFIAGKEISLSAWSIGLFSEKATDRKAMRWLPKLHVWLIIYLVGTSVAVTSYWFTHHKRRDKNTHILVSSRLF